jgi:hypothetical protein
VTALEKFDDAASSLEKLLASLGSDPMAITPEWLQQIRTVTAGVGDIIAAPSFPLSGLRNEAQVARYFNALQDANAAMLLAQQQFSTRLSGMYGAYLRNRNMQSLVESLEQQR